MREALAEAKRELGPDALIVSTREVRRGVLGSEVEVTAAIDDDGATAVGPVEAGTPAFAAQAYGPRGAAPAVAPRRGGLEEIDIERIMAPLRAELRSLRSIIRPLGEVPHELSALRAALPRAGGGAGAAPDVGDDALVAPSQRRVVVLVGPTGVGKTTTLAKLAARAALVERRRVALISLDDYRVGGADQIRTYADLIGVPVRLVDDPTRLRGALDACRDAERIFVDTAGRSPRDREAMWALERVLDGRDDVEVHLTVPAATAPEHLDAIARRHQGLGPVRLLWTKLDEALGLGELIRGPARLGLPVTWVTTGQRVPEDLEAVTAARLRGLAAGTEAVGEVAA
ncbi:MAG: flagellar biosynthesis protein FlhF [Kofleriaceae bacterium]|nr:flagellar biosynthesis protein FlhF [Kofleriaceae bacterium]